MPDELATVGELVEIIAEKAMHGDSAESAIQQLDRTLAMDRPIPLTDQSILILHYPTGDGFDADGTKKENSLIAQGILKQIREGKKNFAFPTAVMAEFSKEGEQKIHAMELWRLEVLEPSGDFAMDTKEHSEDELR